MAVRRNDAGLFEVFVGDEMVARVRSIDEARLEEMRQHNRVLSRIMDELAKQGGIENRSDS